ncbi:MAG: hypothetical protein WA807_04620 [Steroidobacteraceae bacterium]
MTDADFIRALEDCTLAEEEFRHAGHVRAAYLYLQSGDFVEGLGRMRRAIRNYARSLGKPDRYHETITVAYVALIQQVLYERGGGGWTEFARGGGGWTEFARGAPELFEHGLLLKYYSRAQLESDLARRIFVLPGAEALLRQAGAPRSD